MSRVIVIVISAIGLCIRVRGLVISVMGFAIHVIGRIVSTIRVGAPQLATARRLIRPSLSSSPLQTILRGVLDAHSSRQPQQTTVRG